MYVYDELQITVFLICTGKHGTSNRALMFTIRNRVISTAFKQAKRDIDMMLTTAQLQSQLFIYTVYTDV